jgi:phosphate-selective porin OprO and OprP
MVTRFAALCLAALLLPLSSTAQEQDGGVTEIAPAPAPAPAPETKKKPIVEVSAAWGEGLSFKALEGDLSVTLRPRIQFRFLALVPNENSTAARVNQFTIRRARLLLKAKYKEEIGFNFQLAFAPEEQESDNVNPMRDVYLQWTHWRDLQVRIGQMKVPYERQYLTSSSNLELADRGVGVGEFHLERDVGIMLKSDDLFGLGRFQYAIAVMGGEGRNRIGLNQGLLFVGRVTVTPFGAFKDDLVDADLVKHKLPKLALAFSYGRNNATGREKSTQGHFYKNGVLDYDHLAADLIFKWQGLSLQAAWLWRRGSKAFLEGADGSFELTRSGYAWWTQLSYTPVKYVGFGARYGDVFPMGIPTAVKRSRELGGYVNGYVFGNDLKLTADYLYLTNEDWTVGNHQLRLQVEAQF